MLKLISIIKTKVAKLALDRKRNCHISIKTMRLGRKKCPELKIWTLKWKNTWEKLAFKYGTL